MRSPSSVFPSVMNWVTTVIFFLTWRKRNTYEHQQQTSLKKSSTGTSHKTSPSSKGRICGKQKNYSHFEACLLNIGVYGLGELISHRAIPMSIPAPGVHGEVLAAAVEVRIPQPPAVEVAPVLVADALVALVLVLLLRLARFSGGEKRRQSLMIIGPPQGELYCRWTKSISHHLRNPGMMSHL